MNAKFTNFTDALFDGLVEDTPKTRVKIKKLNEGVGRRHGPLKKAYPACKQESMRPRPCKAYPKVTEWLKEAANDGNEIVFVKLDSDCQFNAVPRNNLQKLLELDKKVLDEYNAGYCKVGDKVITDKDDDFCGSYLLNDMHTKELNDLDAEYFWYKNYEMDDKYPIGTVLSKEDFLAEADVPEEDLSELEALEKRVSAKTEGLELKEDDLLIHNRPYNDIELDDFSAGIQAEDLPRDPRFNDDDTEVTIDDETCEDCAPVEYEINEKFDFSKKFDPEDPKPYDMQTEGFLWDHCSFINEDGETEVLTREQAKAVIDYAPMYRITDSTGHRYPNVPKALKSRGKMFNKDGSLKKLNYEKIDNDTFRVFVEN